MTSTFLQILIYHDNRWRLLLKRFICWIFTLDGLFVRLHSGFFQDYGAVVKMWHLWLRSSSFHEHGPSSGDLGFHKCGSGSGALSFHGSGFCSSSHIKFLIVLMYLKLNGKWIKSSAQNYENIPWLAKLRVARKGSSCRMGLFELSEKLYLCFLFLLQSAKVLQSGTFVAVLPF